jgi:hypothetical protein
VCQSVSNDVSYSWKSQIYRSNTILFPFRRNSPKRARAASFLRFLDHTQWHITFGRNPPDEWSARRSNLYLTTHNTHKRQKYMPPAGFEPHISASGRPQTLALDRSATNSGLRLLLLYRKSYLYRWEENTANGLRGDTVLNLVHEHRKGWTRYLDARML